jgi:predicted esterase YcpF (UPF0227 family)
LRGNVASLDLAALLLTALTPDVLMTSILYIHGMNSSPASLKARVLRAAMQRLGLAAQLQVPALAHDPLQAMQQLEAAVAALGRPLLVGSSLGGYYATHLAERHGLKAVLINPAVRPQWLFEAHLGAQQNYYSGETWQLTLAHVAALASLEVPAPQDAGRYQVWLQTADETLDYRAAERYYRACSLRIQAGGEHGFRGFAACLPALFAFAGIAPALWRDADFSDL